MNKTGLGTEDHPAPYSLFEEIGVVQRVDHVPRSEIPDGTEVVYLMDGTLYRRSWDGDPVEIGGGGGSSGYWDETDAGELTPGDGQPVTVDALTVGGDPSELHWDEDDNSPTSFSGSDSHTFTLAGEYDEVMVVFHDIDFGSSVQSFKFLGLRVNGDTGSNYDYVEASGAETEADTEWPFMGGQNTYSPSAYAYLMGRWSANICMAADPLYGDTQVAETGYNASVSSPLTQFTIVNLTDTTDFAVDVEVYGRYVA